MEQQAVALTLDDLKSQDIENNSCIDCQSDFTTHVSIDHGSFICSTCAESHLKLANASKIMSTSDMISEAESRFMVNGGNKAFSEFLKYYGLMSTPINFKYNTKAVCFYRYMLKKISVDQEIDLEMPGQTEGCELVSKSQNVDLNSTNIIEPLLTSQSQEPSIFNKMFRCFFVTSSKIQEKVSDKFKKFSEKPSVKHAEIKTKEFLERVGKGVENSVKSFSSKSKQQKNENLDEGPTSTISREEPDNINYLI
jgi:hypothetical protein